MALKDSFKKLMNYFEMDDTADYVEQSEAYQMPNETPTMRVAQKPASAAPQREARRATPTRSNQTITTVPAAGRAEEQTSMQRLHERQQEIGGATAEKSTIDIKFPKRYEEARDIVNLLIDNVSVFIDFQFMSEVQARRCLDYLDGARSVLFGNLKKVSNSMWLLTPANVVVNVEDLRHVTASQQEAGYDFDMKR